MPDWFGVIMMSVAAAFENLSIDQAGLIELQVDSLKRFSLMLFTFPGPSGNSPGGKQYDLRFNKIIDYKFDMTSFSCEVCIVQSHAAFRNSEFLSSCMAGPKKFSRKVIFEHLCHFQIIFDRGRLDVVAEDFACDLIWET